MTYFKAKPSAHNKNISIERNLQGMAIATHNMLILPCKQLGDIH